MKSITKKTNITITLVLIFILTMLLLLTGCNTSSTTLYNYGIEMTTLMEEMVKNENFKNSITYDLSSFIANDYDTPTNVYKISVPTSLEIIHENNEIYELWDKLPDNLKEQIENKFSFYTIISLIISSENENINDSYFSISWYAKKTFNGNIDKSIAYLYTFETGKPIIVIFENDNNKISATSFFIPSKSLNTLSNIREIFKKYNCNVNKLEI